VETKANAPGRLIRCPEGYTAFLPHPLPPGLTWTDSLVRSLSDATLMIGRLGGEGRRLPDPHLLIRPFVHKEAERSSRIEGTQATLGEVLAVDAGIPVRCRPEDLREIANYVDALDYGIDRLKTLPLSIRLVRELHARLMEGVRGNQATPGELRRSQNWIGAPGCTAVNATYVPPPPAEMVEALNGWEKFLHDTSLPPLVQIALAHYQFEAIHPFLDGNGRVGRLLITLFMVERQLLPSPLLYLSAFFEATRDDYYERLRGVSSHGAWGAWLEYFLNGVTRQAEDALSRATRINTLLGDWRLLVAGISSKAPARLVDLLAENPFWTVNRAAARLEVAYTTAQRAIEKLISLDILTQTREAKRDRAYCATAILEILDEPARLTPLPPT